MNTIVKKVASAVSENNQEVAQQALGEALKILDKSASRRLIHRKKAARKKSRLTRAVNKLAAGA
jgi:small subunit ribosomal protein S20